MDAEKPDLENLNEYLEYLDELRKNGATNMFRARPYLTKRFPELTDMQARQIVTYWMHTFSERHPTE